MLWKIYTSVWLAIWLKYFELCLLFLLSFYLDSEKRKLLFFHKLKILSLTAAQKVIFLM